MGQHQVEKCKYVATSIFWKSLKIKFCPVIRIEQLLVNKFNNRLQTGTKVCLKQLMFILFSP